MLSHSGIMVVPELPSCISYDPKGPIAVTRQSIVYYGYDDHAKRPVVLKFLQSHLVVDPVAHARFRREAEWTHRIKDRRTPQVYAFVASPTQPCIVMEYFAGRTLTKRIRDTNQGPLASAECRRIGAELADIVAGAHRHGVLHRDIKPDNLILTSGGETSLGVRLIDWGIATTVDQMSATAEMPVRGARNGDSLTSTRGLVGTLPYIAPEQLELQPASPQTDVYGMGATLFHAAVGRPPLEATTPVELEKKLEEEDPVPLRQLRPDLPTLLTTTIDHTLAKDPDDRPNSFELEEALLAAA